MDVNDNFEVGVVAQNAWTSDGRGDVAELGEVERAEKVDIGSRDNPPFATGAGTSASADASGFIAGTASPTPDRHTYPPASISTGGLAPGTYTLVYRQNFLFNDRRTGVVNQVAEHSGFTITHTINVRNRPIVGRSVEHLTVKTGAAVSVEGRSATAGMGTAASDVHPF
jgi:hypothetical protein